MAAVTDARPGDVVAEVAAVAQAVGRVVPAKSAGNLLIGTWNVRAFDRVSPVWRSAPGASPIRDLSNVLVIAEVVRRFDVVAVQEVRRSAQAFLAMMSVLGPDWAYLVTDVTDGSAGNSERLAFVFDTTRLRLSGLACELVVAAADNAAVAPEVLTGQFARTPYAVSFARGETRFTLVTLHVVYGQAPADRIAELAGIAHWLDRWSRNGDAWGTNLIALGDFNIDRQGDPLYDAFTSTGLRPPDPLNFVPRTVFDDPDPVAAPDRRHFYDQIAWFTRPTAPRNSTWVTATPACTTSPTTSSAPTPPPSCPGGSLTTSPSGANSPPRGCAAIQRLHVRVRCRMTAVG